MLHLLRLATVTLFLSASVWSQETTDNKPSTSSASPCANAAGKDERTACWQDLARKAKAYLTGDPCPHATSDMARTNCWLDLAIQANTRLAAYYQKVRKAVRAHLAQQPPDSKRYDERALEELKTAQLAWSHYRDSQCNAAEHRYEGGTIAPSIRAGCERDLAEQRMEELHQTYAMYLVAQ